MIVVLRLLGIILEIKFFKSTNTYIHTCMYTYLNHTYIHLYKTVYMHVRIIWTYMYTYTCMYYIQPYLSVFHES